ncbi:MAG: MotA/TolQ/ExbB proton channel family protein [Proteobacteria bacterium]|nr:MotA/TolQ/ExbB proton channel family protein [Pseudomonadota bacterium]
MDIATIIGLVGAFGIIYMAISANAAAFVDTASLLIVVAGSIAVVLARCTLGEFLGAIGVLGKAFSRKIENPFELINQLVELATIARKDGMIALEGQDIKNAYMAKAVAMLVDGTDPDIIKSSLERDTAMMKQRHGMGVGVFSAWGEIAPAMGMVGTLAGLVIMLGNMSDPKSIGPAMAIALLTTMYGAILANVICLPMAQKLANASALEAANNELILEGVLFMQSGGNPRVMGDMLASFVAPKMRSKIAAQ